MNVTRRRRALRNTLTAALLYCASPAIGQEAASPGLDSDRDGITDVLEVRLGTHPLVPDTDGDGILDGIEAGPDGELRPGETDPLDADSDDDGLSDGEEAGADGTIRFGETDPLLADTDHDGIADGVELGLIRGIADPDGDGPLLGTDPNVFRPDADPNTVSDPLDMDTDGGGTLDGQEDANGNGRLDLGESDPLRPRDDGERADPMHFDSDEDGLADGVELRLGTNPYRADTDGDGVDDIVEVGHDGERGIGETDPLDADSDDDGLSDGAEFGLNGTIDWGETDPLLADSDHDGIADGIELGLIRGVPDPDGDGPLRGTGPGFVPDADPGTTTSPVVRDTDGDGRADGDEDLNRNGRVDPGEGDPLFAEDGTIGPRRAADAPPRAVGRTASAERRYAAPAAEAERVRPGGAPRVALGQRVAERFEGPNGARLSPATARFPTDDREDHRAASPLGTPVAGGCAQAPGRDAAWFALALLPLLRRRR